MGKYILFDMDGVLVNTEPMHFEIWKKVFKEKGIDIDYEHYKGCIGSTRSFLYNYDMIGNQMVNAGALHQMLKPYKAHLITGHTHYNLKCRIR